MHKGSSKLMCISNINIYTAEWGSVPMVTLFHESACFQKSAWHVHMVVGQIFENACT